MKKRNIGETYSKDNTNTIEFEIKKINDLVKYSDNFGKLHKHDFYFILFLTKGSCLQNVDFKNKSIQEKQVLFMYPGQVHGFKYRQSSKGFTMYFTNSFVDNPNSSAYKIHQLLCTQKLSQIISLTNQQTKDFETNFNVLYSEFKSAQINKNELLKAYVEIILTKLLRHLNICNYSLNSQNTFFKIVELVELYYAQNTSIKTISKELGLTSKKLNTQSKEYFGKTFLTLINERKLLEIKRLITTSDLSIKEIAYRCGFSDSAYLNNFFKKNMGVTPLNFKKNSK